MGNEQMPDDRLKRLGVGRDRFRIDRWDNDACIGHSGGVAAVPANHAGYLGADSFGIFQGFHQIWADVLLEITAADRKHKHGILRDEFADLEPFNKNRCPAFVVGACRQFRDVVGRGVRFDANNLPKVVDGILPRMSMASSRC